ncbi:MAG: TonB-dependent receptor plug domain-containing protein [Campylobacter sp.]|nr:TonB-dependent receptor plug domain-containing protein [Campylobacter sp.]
MRTNLYFLTAFALILHAQLFADEIAISEVRVESVDSNSTMPRLGKYGSGVTYINKEYIDKMPNSQGGLTQLVRMNPSVRYNTGQRTSMNGAEVQPDDISIHGAPHWQNNFMIDGVNFNNDLNPRQRRRTAFGYEFNQNAAVPDIGSISQGMNLDSSLIKSVNIHTHNISAEYGQFQGGVIEVETRDPSEEFSGEISVKHTNDSWRKVFIDPQSYEDYKSKTDHSMQSDYEKWRYNLRLEGYLTENFGLLFSASQMRSSFVNFNDTIGSNTVYWDPNAESEQRKEKRRNDNYFLKGIWHANERLTIRPEITYTPSYSTYYNNYSSNSNYKIREDGLIGSVDFDYDGDIVDINTTVSYSKMTSSKDSKTQYYITHPWSDRFNWGDSSRGARAYSNIGAYGDIDQEQKKLSYKSKFEFREFDLGDTQHFVSSGIQISRSSGSYKIPGYFTAGSATNRLKPLGAGEHCMPGDELCYENLTGIVNPIYTNGYYWAMISGYEGKAKVNVNEYGLWLQDNISWGNFNIRPGVRLDYDNLSSQFNISPRLALDYDIFGNDKSIINLGYSRYYGRNIFAYALRNGMNSLGYTCRRNSPSEKMVCENDGSLPRYKLDELKIPYNDEFAIGFKQRISNLELQANYIKRYGRDEIRSKSYFNFAWGGNIPPNYDPNMDTYYFEYDNSGKSETDTYEFRLASIEDFAIFGTSNGIELSASYMKSKRNYNSADDYLDREDGYEYTTGGDKRYTDKVIYNGNIIDKKDLPDYDFREPWMVKLTTKTKLSPISLGFTKMTTNITNYFNWRSRHDLIYRAGDIQTPEYGELAVYEKFKDGGKITWDAEIGFEFSAPKNTTFFANLEIYNVLNQKAISGRYVDYWGNVYSSYEPGREFWLEVGYKW